MKKFFIKYREIIVYLIVGVLTTLISYGVRFAVLYGGSSLFGIDLGNDTAGNTIALRAVAPTIGWAVAVLFAFYPNKIWVFKDEDKEKKRTVIQFFEFVGSRVGTYFAEMGLAVLFPMLLAALGYKTFHFIIDVDADVMTAVVSMIIITILNYVLSKFLVFRKKKEQ
ncbi:MAG: GtrA family protein [Clostridia bacterium]|nr:GtrA family protein [Clostridia bacterium]